MKKKIIHYKKVSLPHIQTTVYFLDMSKLKLIGMDIGNSSGFCIESRNTFKEDGMTEISIFLKDIERVVKDIRYMPVVAHEIMHAIQIMCDHLGMNVQEEKEHTAYIMHYLIKELIDTN